MSTAALLERPALRTRKSWSEKPWKEIMLGVGQKSPDEACIEMRKSGFCVSALVQELMKQPDFILSPREEKVSLVVKTPADLQMLWRSTRERVIERAQEAGYGLCSAEVGLQLRRQYHDQPLDEWLFIAMEPIIDPIKDRPWILNVGHALGGLWLAASLANPHTENPDEFLLPDSRLVFTVPYDMS